MDDLVRQLSSLRQIDAAYDWDAACEERRTVAIAALAATDATRQVIVRFRALCGVCVVACMLALLHWGPWHPVFAVPLWGERADIPLALICALVVGVSCVGMLRKPERYSAAAVDTRRPQPEDFPAVLYRAQVAAGRFTVSRRHRSGWVEVAEGEVTEERAAQLHDQVVELQVASDAERMDAYVRADAEWKADQAARHRGAPAIR